MPTAVVWNPRAGGADAAAALRDEIRRRPDFEILEASERDDVIAAVARALGNGAARIYCAGGDGTVSAALDALVHSERRVPLGVIPLGTGNDFCRTLTMPLEPADALAHLDRAAERDLDVVEMAEDGRQPHYYINMASAGNSDRVIEQITDEQKEWWGPLIYLRGAINVANDLESYRVAIEDAAGHHESFEVWNVMVANGRTSAGGFSVAPLAQPDDGKIDLVIVRAGTLPDLVEAGTRLLMESLLESNLIEYRRSPRFTIESNPPLRFTADGELVEWMPVRFEVRPGAMRVLVGPEFGAPPAEETGGPSMAMMRLQDGQ